MRRALIIATRVYQDPEFADLPGAVVDANSLDEVLSDPAIGNFETKILRDRGLREIARAVGKHFGEAKPDDFLLLHISGHGVKDAHGNLFFAASDTDHTPYLLNATALSAAHIRQEMGDSPARRIILLLDCCYSGAFFHDRRSRGDDPADLTRPFQRRGPFYGRGHVVITASSAVQLASEVDGQGVFTRAVVEGLRTGQADRNGDGIIDTDELYRYVVEAVRRETSRQTPTLSAHNVQGMLDVARNPSPDAPAVGPLDGEQPGTGLRGRLRNLAATGLAGLHRLYRRVREGSPGPLPRQLAVPVLTLWGLLLGFGAYADAAALSLNCAPPAEIRMATSDAGYLTYREVADAYERWAARRNNGCATVRLYLYPATTDEVRADIRANRSGGDEVRADIRGDRSGGDEPEPGTPPDLWLPESTVDLDGVIADELDPIASTPLVLGVPRRLAEFDGAENVRRMALSWPELFARAAHPAVRPERPGDPAGAAAWGVVRANPTASTVANLATVALYRIGESRLRSELQARRDVERWLERSLDAGKYPIGGDAALLCRQRTLGATSTPTPAVILTEQALVRFNQGRPLGAGCGTRQRPADMQQLRAFYPSDSPVVVQTVARLRWPPSIQAPAIRAAVDDFVDWLTHDGQRALLDAGLRPWSPRTDELRGPADGALPDWPFGNPHDDTEIAGKDRIAVLETYGKAQRPARILVALDASGSMRDETETPGRTRFEVALDAVDGSLPEVGSSEEFGLLSFSSDRANFRQLAPIGPLTDARARGARTAAKQISPSGNTPLYQAIRQGSGLLRAGGAESLRALVVITDGQDTSGRPAPTAAELAGVRLYFLAVGDVSCAGSMLERLSEGAGGECFDTTADNIDTVLSHLFEGLWKGAS